MANGLTREEAEANAERIRLCWNSHEALVAALERILTEIPMKRDWPSLDNQARAALALAKGEAK
jgi:hypothetical protein